MYTTIIHPIRKALHLSCNEYIVLDQIWRLSKNEKYGNWCVATKKQIAEWMDLGEATIFRAIEVLIQKGLVLKNDQGNLKTSDEWNEQMANSHDWGVMFKGQETQYISEKVNSDRHSIKMIDDTLSKRSNDSIKMIDYNKNTLTNNKYILSNDNRDKSQGTRQNYGNVEINNMILALKGKIEISAFVDSAIERNMARHCVKLMEKIGKDEFVRRLEELLLDPFHHKNCNKIRYVYNNIKGFIGSSPKTNIAIIS